MNGTPASKFLYGLRELFLEVARKLFMHQRLWQVDIIRNLPLSPRGERGEKRAR
ncbi:hypothetical protein CCP3SC1_30061 [Gammaproteobacteria bacterium]